MTDRGGADMVTDREKKQTGKAGEEAACRFLADRGHVILARNWRSGHLEIDIISMDKAGIHFVEVKTRRPPMQALPQESVTPGKQRKIAAAAARYLASGAGRQTGDMECQFDIIAVTLSEGGAGIEYYPAAFWPVCV